MIKVSQEFLDNFSLCMKFYECTDEEIIKAKAAVRNDYDTASRSYSEIAGNIRLFPDIKKDEKYILVSDIVFDKPKEEVKKSSKKKSAPKKVKEADKLKLKD